MTKMSSENHNQFSNTSGFGSNSESQSNAQERRFQRQFWRRHIKGILGQLNKSYENKICFG